ncbi:hypothetical protein [uncultured Chryseobacterium sp.]|uniref:hypothetical protein n=1 Tax=uncultured Chryseobacterium sp. TaxID=259322 RepID=UPI0025EFFF14|nr:hypothetical protein [uncultured Chryseobacterium sp.]
MIDIDRVQQIIEKEISPDFKISRYFDTEDMVIYFWTHKEYDPDDERGWIIGSGPVVYDKKTKEYRVMGSREWFSKEICKLFETEEEKERMRELDYLMSLFENGEENPDYTHSLIEIIKANILRRKYVNSEDVDFLSILTGARRIDKEFDLMFKPQWKHNQHILVVSDHIFAQEKLMKIWKEIDFEYKLLSENELLLFRKKSIS